MPTCPNRFLQSLADVTFGAEAVHNPPAQAGADSDLELAGQPGPGELVQQQSVEENKAGLRTCPALDRHASPAAAARGGGHRGPLGLRRSRMRPDAGLRFGRLPNWIATERSVPDSLDQFDENRIALVRTKPSSLTEWRRRRLPYRRWNRCGNPIASEFLFWQRVAFAVGKCCCSTKHPSTALQGDHGRPVVALRKTHGTEMCRAKTLGERHFHSVTLMEFESLGKAMWRRKRFAQSSRFRPSSMLSKTQLLQQSKSSNAARSNSARIATAITDSASLPPRSPTG